MDKEHISGDAFFCKRLITHISQNINLANYLVE